MGVLYEVGDDLRQLLVPFARARGCELTDHAIHEAYVRAMIGDLTTAQLWNELGVAGYAKDLNREYLRAISSFQASPHCWMTCANRASSWGASPTMSRSGDVVIVRAPHVEHREL